MLVFTRKTNESIRIADDVVVTLVSVEARGNRARIGIFAPPEIPINRQEVYHANTLNQFRDLVFVSPVLRTTMQSWTDKQTVLRRIGVAIGIPKIISFAGTERLNIEEKILDALMNEGIIEHDGSGNYRFHSRGS